MLQIPSLLEIESHPPQLRVINAASLLDAMLQGLDADSGERPLKDRIYSADSEWRLDRPAIFWALDRRNDAAHAPLKSSTHDYVRAADILLRAARQILPLVSSDLQRAASGSNIETRSHETIDDTPNSLDVCSKPAARDLERPRSSLSTYVVVCCAAICVLYVLLGIVPKLEVQLPLSLAPPMTADSVGRPRPKIDTLQNLPRGITSTVSSASEVRRQRQAEAELARQSENKRLELMRARQAAISPRVIPQSATAEQLAHERSPQSFVSSIGLEMRLIPSGEFTMGSHLHINAQPHIAEIREILYMAAHETTQREYRQVTGIALSRNDGIVRSSYPPGWAPSPTHLPDPRARDNLPVENVTWEEAVSFCKALTSKDQGAGVLAKGWEYRLPTEAEWEYAARAGSNSRWCFGNNGAEIVSHAWSDRTSGGRSHLVGQKQPNRWGLYDVHGNVWEWCHDWFVADYGSAATFNPLGPSEGRERIIRGGSFSNDAARCGVSERGHLAPAARFSNVGFRVALSASIPTQGDAQSVAARPPRSEVEQTKNKLGTDGNAIVASKQVLSKPPGPRLGVFAKKCSDGIHIESVITGSPATRCIDVGSKEYLQLEEGDHILSVNGIEPITYEEFLRLIATSDPKMSFIIRDQRSQQVRRMAATLAW